MCLCVCVCVCVTERDRQRDRETEKVGPKDVSSEEFKYILCQYMWKVSQGHSSEGQFAFGCRHCGMFALKDWLFYSYHS